MSGTKPAKEQRRKPDLDPKVVVMSVRVSPDLRRRMREACCHGPYRIAMSSLVQRGIELALTELANAARAKEQRR